MALDPKSFDDKSIMERTAVEADEKGRIRYVFALPDDSGRSVSSEHFNPESTTVSKGKLIMQWCDSVREQIGAWGAEEEAERIAKKRRERDEGSAPTETSATETSSAASTSAGTSSISDPTAYVKDQYEHAARMVAVIEDEIEEATAKLAEFTLSMERWHKALEALNGDQDESTD